MPHGYASFKHICNVIIGLCWWHEQIKACVTFTRSLNHKKEERKEKNGLKLNFLSFPSLFFFSLSLSLSLSCQYSSLLTPEKHARGRSFSCVCLLSENKKPFFFTYDFTRSYITQILEHFCQGQIACNGQLYFQLL